MNLRLKCVVMSESRSINGMTVIADGWDVIWQNAINISKNKEQNNYDQIVGHVEATSKRKA